MATGWDSLYAVADELQLLVKSAASFRSGWVVRILISETPTSKNEQWRLEGTQRPTKAYKGKNNGEEGKDSFLAVNEWLDEVLTMTTGNV